MATETGLLNWQSIALVNECGSIIIIIIIFIHSESAHARALASYIVTEFWTARWRTTLTAALK